LLNIISKNIRVKLSLSIGLVLVSLVVVFLAYNSLTIKLIKGIETSGHRYMPGLSSVLNADRDLYQAYAAQLEYLSSENPDSKPDFEENAQQATDKMHVFIDLLAQHPKLVDELKAFDSTYGVWKKSSEQFFKLLDQGNKEAAQALLLGENKKNFSELRELFNIAGELLEQQSETSIASLSSDITQYKLWLLFFVIAVIGVSTFLTYVVPKLLVNGIDELSKRIKEIREGDGDLTQRINTQRKDQLGLLANEFDGFIIKLQALINEIKENSISLNTSSQELKLMSNSNKDLNYAQNQKIEVIVTAVNEFSVSIREVAENTLNASTATNETTEMTKDGMLLINQSVQEVKELSASIQQANDDIRTLTEESDNIATVLDVIRNIAEQTNLLALNAAIEAARAGEHGRGFAVVADEVRSLASKTQKSTNEIQQMIDKLQEGVKNAVTSIEDGFEKVQRNVESTDKTQLMFESINNSTSLISDMVTQIAAATEEQGHVSEDINNNIVSVNDQNRESLDVSEKFYQVSEDVNNLSEKLNSNVDQFKVS